MVSHVIRIRYDKIKGFGASLGRVDAGRIGCISVSGPIPAGLCRLFRRLERCVRRAGVWISEVAWALGHWMDKSLQTSNWDQRPLSTAQKARGRRRQRVNTIPSEET